MRISTFKWLFSGKSAKTPDTIYSQPSLSLKCSFIGSFRPNKLEAALSEIPADWMVGKGFQYFRQ